MSIRCVLCGNAVDERDAYRRIIGWERKSTLASRRSGSDIALREAQPEHACDACITRLKAGLDVRQEALL